MPAAVHMQAEDDASSPQVMNQFYRRLFPYKPFFKWLSQEQIPSRLFTHREFAFTLAGDVYLRYNSFHNVDEFKKEVIRLNPSRFEIGPQYSARPRDRKTLAAGALVPQRRELVFDIDMTDYDDVRTCCNEANICKRCWGFIAAAVKVLDHCLRDTFGFRRLLWVYSGRRGIHVWISDQAALDLTDDQRKAIVTYIEVIKGSKEQAKKVNVRGPKGDNMLHPGIDEAYNTLGPIFVELALKDQEVFQTERGWETLLSLLPADTNDQAELRREWQATPDASSLKRWKQVLGKMKDPRYQRAVEDIILQYTYPRIDAEVSKHRNHLLKSPFCVHPKTGRVCVPINPALIDEFDPMTVPTVGELLRELNAAAEDEMDDGTSKRGEDYDRTSLKPYIDLFEKHVAEVMKDMLEVKRERGGIRLDF